jgi:hypothetical protein
LCTSGTTESCRSREDVLEPLKIELDPACEIIDARILKVSRAVTKFAKGEVSDTAKNVLPVSFGILERNDGAQLQVIYTGRPDARVSVSGTIVGAAQTRESTTPQDRPPNKNRRLTLLLVLVLSASIAVATLTLSKHSQWVRQEGPIGRRPDLYFALGFFLAMAVPGVAVVAYDAWKSQPAVPSTIWNETQK